MEKLLLNVHPGSVLPLSAALTGPQQDMHAALARFQHTSMSFRTTEHSTRESTDSVTSFIAQLRVALTRNLARAIVHA